MQPAHSSTVMLSTGHVVPASLGTEQALWPPTIQPVRLRVAQAWRVLMNAPSFTLPPAHRACARHLVLGDLHSPIHYNPLLWTLETTVQRTKDSSDVKEPEPDLETRSSVEVSNLELLVFQMDTFFPSCCSLVPPMPDYIGEKRTGQVNRPALPF